MKKTRSKITMWLAVLSVLIMTLSLAACGAKEEPAPAEDTAASQETEAVAEDPGLASEPVEEARDPHEDYIGKWTVAGAESQGLMLGGNFGAAIGLEELPSIEFEDYENGNFDFGTNDNGEEEIVAFTWDLDGNGGATLKFEKEVEVLKSDTATVSYSEEDAAIFMDYKENDQEAVLIFTLDGIYSKAKVITMDGAEPITSEDELIGDWTMIGMNMGGISMSGSAEAFQADGNETFVNFKEGGVAEMNGNEGTWKVDENGATMTSSDVTGEHDFPVMKIGNNIVMDCSESLGGADFIILFEKK